MKHFKWLSTLTLLLAFICQVSAQDNLDVGYASAATVPDFLNVCGDPDDIVVTISINGTDPNPRSNIIATTNLFPGVEIVNFNPALSSPGVLLISSADPNMPIFEIPDLSPGGTTSVDIAFSIQATCAIPDTIAANNSVSIFDIWDLNYNLGTFVLLESDPTQEYRDAFAVPFFTTNVVNNVSAAREGDCFTRDILVTNSGLDGFVDSLLYENIQGPGVSVTDIQVNGIPLVFSKTVDINGDTIVSGYLDMTHFPSNTIGGGGSNGDGFFDPNETATVTESICVTDCDLGRSSEHIFSWGCYGSTCGTVSTNDFVAIGQGAANVSITPTGSIPDVNAGYCIAGNTSLTVTNNGVEIDPGFAAMIDIETGIGMGNTFALTDNQYNITSLVIAGVTIAPLATQVDLNNNALFTTDPDGPGGLEDLDGDGFFDDLAAGESYEMTAYYEFDCVGADTLDAANACVNEYSTFFSGRSLYYDACNDFNPILASSYFRPTNNNSDIQNFTQPDANIASDTFYISHFEERSILSFDKDCGGSEEYYLKIALPTGITPVFSTVQLFRNGGSIPFTVNSTSIVNDTAYVRFDGTNPFLTGRYDLRMGFTADCTTVIGPSEFPIEFGYSCPSCSCSHVWYCGTVQGPQLHTTDPPCPPLKCPEGVQTTEFSVERTTFGYTDNTYTTPIDEALANKKVAISCDSVQMRVMSVVGDLPISDSIGVTITYNNVDGTYSTDETFLFDYADVRINNQGTDYFCTLTAADLVVTSVDSIKTLEFDLHNCLVANGLTLDSMDVIEFIGNFTVNPDGPYPTQFRSVPNLRGYAYGRIDGDKFACDNWGDVFTIAKNQTVFAAPGSSEFPSGCEEANLAYRLITVNNGFTDWFGTEYRQAISVDSIVFTYDPSLLDVFDSFIPEVSFPGHPVYGNAFYPVNGFSASDNGVYVATFDTLSTVPALNDVLSYSFNFRIRAVPSCKALQGSNAGTNLYGFDTEIYWQDRYYGTDIGDGSCSTLEKDSSFTNLSYTDPPSFALTPISAPNINIAGDTAEWVVQLCNNSFEADAGLTWLSVVDTNAAVQIFSIEDISIPTSPVSLTVTPYATSDYYVISDGLLRADPGNTIDEICNTYRIKGLVQKCGNYQLDLNSGWNCGPITDPLWTPLDYPPCDELAMPVTFTTLDPFLDANVVEQPGGTNPDLCDTITIGIIVRNTDLGSLYDLNSNIILPLQGATLVPGSFEVAYPSGGTYIPALGDPTYTGTTIQGNVYNYPDFSMLHSFLDVNGLAGFDPGNPTDSNELIIRYQFVTDCDYISGSLNYFNFVGDKSCADTTNFEAGETLPIHLNGTNAGGTKLFDISVTNGTGLLSGGTGTIDLCATNLTNTLSDATDQVMLNLPSGVTYSGGSSIATTPTGWVVGEPASQDVNGVTMLTWTLPAGMVLNDQACFSFDLTSPAYTCDIDSIEVVLTTVTANNLLCTTSGANCAAMSNTSTNNGSTLIPILQNNLMLDIVSMTSICAPTDSENITITGNVVNNSPTTNLPAVSLDVYFDINANNVVDGPDVLLANFADPNALAPNSSIPFTMNFSATENSLCQMIAQIDTTGYNSCGNALFNLNAPQLLTAGADSTYCVAAGSGITGPIGDANCGSMTGYTFNWTAIAPATVAELDDTTIPNPTVTINDPINPSDVYQYVVQTSRPNCGVSIDTVAISFASGTPITAVAMPDTIGCGGGTMPLLVATGATTYEWYDSANTLLGTNDSLIVNPAITSTYTVNSTDVGGCTSTAQVTVTVLNATPVTAVASPDTIGCGGANMPLLVATGGVSYEWYDSAATLLGTNDSLIVNPTATSVYTVNSIDAGGCASSAQVTVTVLNGPMVTASASPDTLTCTTTLTTLTAAGAVNYDWYDTAFIASGGSITMAPTTNTTYMVVGTDVNACTDTAFVAVVVAGGAGTAFASASQDTICVGETVTLSGGTAANLTWFDDMSNNVGAGASINVNPISTTNYMLVADDGPTCSDTAFVAVVVNSVPAITFSSGTVNDCNGTSIPVNVAVTDSIVNYVINGTGTFINDALVSASSLTFDAIYNGVDEFLDVTIQNEFGCTLVERINIVACGTCADELATGTYTVNATCGNSDGVAEVGVIGSAASYTYTWDPSIGTANVDGNRREDLPAGSYTVTVADINAAACTEVVTVVVSNTDGPDASYFPTASDCAIANGTATMSPLNFTYTWADGPVSNFRDDLPSGNIIVTIEDPANPGCTSTIEVVIPENNTLEADVTLNNLAHCGVNDGTATINMNGGSGTYSFSWPSGIATQDSLAAGTHRVTVTDTGSTGCELPVIFVMLDSVPPATVTIDSVYNISCPGVADGSVDFSIVYDAAFVGPADTIITNTFDTFVNGVFAPGAYCIEIRDASGCVAGGDCFTITSPDPVDLVFDTYPACAGPDSLQVDLTISGGTLPYFVNWFDLAGTDNTEDRYNITNGVYDVEVMDANGCLVSFNNLLVPDCPLTGCNIGLTVSSDTLITTVDGCTTSASFCIEEDPFVLSTYSIFDNGVPYTAGLDPCGFEMSQGYDYATLFGAGNLGPYSVNSWTVDNNTYTGQFNTLDELVDSLNTWNPLGNWSYAASPMFIYGGDSNIFNYGQLVIEAIDFGAVSTFPYTALMTPTGYGIAVAPGFHELIVVDSITGCADTLYAMIDCNDIENVYDTIFIDESVTYCIDTSTLNIGTVVSMMNVCPELADGNVEFEIDPATYCVTYTGLTLGIDTACIQFCDAMNVCDTINFYITVEPEFDLVTDWFVDSVYVFETDELCIDTTELPGNVVSIDNFCLDNSGTEVEFFINPLTYCVEYTGLAIGKDTACIEVCDDLGYCDTTYMCIYVPIYNDPPVAVDDYDTTFINVPVVVSLKPNDTLFGGVDSIYLISDPLYGEATLNFDCTVTYNPGDEFCARTDYFDYVVCTPTGCDTATIHIYIECTDIVIFTAVSPNKDGVNDGFFIAGIEDFPDSRLCLYNRWGNKIYEKIGYQNDWQGTWGGDKDLPDGTYFYVLELNDEDKRKFSGYFELFR